MDDGYERPQRPSQAGRGSEGGVRSRPHAGSGRLPNRDGEVKQTGGLLSRYAARQDEAEQEKQEKQERAPEATIWPDTPSAAPPYVPGGQQQQKQQSYGSGGQAQAANGDAAGRYVPGGGGGDDGARSDDAAASRQGNGPREPWSTPLNDRLRSRQDGEGKRGAWQALTGQARRIGANIRRTAGAGQDSREPRAGEWRATDFEPTELEEWDRKDSAPFEVPVNADDELDFAYTAARSRRMSGGRPRDEQRGPTRGARSGPRGGGGGAGGDRSNNQWDGGWETGTWDTGWATGQQQSMEYSRAGAFGDGDSGFWAPGRDSDDGGRDALDESLSTLAQLGAVGVPLGRLARVRLLLRQRPAAAAMLAFFLLGFMLTCCAPLIPVLRLGYDAADAARRVSNLQAIFAGGSSTLFNAAKLKDAQVEVDGITHDLYEINGAMNVAGAPLAAVSPQIRNYRLLVRMGFDLTASADEGLQVAQTLLTPLQGGAFSSDSPGITPDDIARARAVLTDADARMQDALTAYHQLDVAALPSQLQPDTRYGKLLGLLPEAQGTIGEMQSLLEFVPAMLGIGTPASYLVVAMDRSELRPGGGFQGNYGFLVLDGGKQSKSQPLKLNDTYALDATYYSKFVQDQNNCATTGPQPPLYYWWWPYRDDPKCRYGWGLRDSNLSADFPTNALTAMQIVRDAGQLPPNTSLQGEIAFTPVLIEKLLALTGPITLSGYGVTVNDQNVEHEIHEEQLNKASSGTDRKVFTHDLATALLDKVKSMHGSALKSVLQVAQDAIREKDLQIYFTDPRAELILQQLSLGSTANRSAADGFFVVDTNYGGNKANTYVTEHQTDYVTLLPDGGALHQLQISVNYAKTGNVYNEQVQQEDYMDMQRTYMPGDATILGYSGFFPSGIFFPSGCGGEITAAPITDCSDGYDNYAFKHPTTTSDIAGRTMVMGSLMISCGDTMPITDTVETYQDFVDWANAGGPGGGQLPGDFQRCDTNPVARTQNIYVEWYTPHAYTMSATGHGTYSDLVEKQPGSSDFAILSHPGDYLTVYVDASHIHGSGVDLSNAQITTAAQFASLISGKKPVFNDKLLSDETISYNF